MLASNYQPYMWGEEQEVAFMELKEHLALAPILQRPIEVV
jgi:hypothetical protein